MKTIGRIADQALSRLLPQSKAAAVDCNSGYSYWSRCYPNPACGSSGYQKTLNKCVCGPGACWWDRYTRRCC
ncbi:hypothetical protein [Nonomuraea sp. NPDC049400]|uniref:hypothetical protein n=1 Tax=Nonomuraea sp. NPDC049400 TaxID=3364352 RepID=UPI0037BC4BFD